MSICAPNTLIEFEGNHVWNELNWTEWMKTTICAQQSSMQIQFHNVAIFFYFLFSNIFVKWKVLRFCNALHEHAQMLYTTSHNWCNRLARMSLHTKKIHSRVICLELSNSRFLSPAQNVMCIFWLSMREWIAAIYVGNCRHSTPSSTFIDCHNIHFVKQNRWKWNWCTLNIVIHSMNTS